MAEIRWRGYKPHEVWAQAKEIVTFQSYYLKIGSDRSGQVLGNVWLRFYFKKVQLKFGQEWRRNHAQRPTVDVLSKRKGHKLDKTKRRLHIGTDRYSRSNYIGRLFWRLNCQVWTISSLEWSNHFIFDWGHWSNRYSQWRYCLCYSFC